MPKTPATPVDLEEVQLELTNLGNPWLNGDTSMTVLTEEERRVRLGVPLPDPVAVDRIISDASRMTATSLASDSTSGAPAAFDARNVGGNDYTTPVKDQGNCGSCVAFGTVATMETTAAYQRGQAKFDPDLSEAHLFYVHGKADNANCDTGWMPSRAFSYCQNIGITFEDYFPYTPRNTAGATLNSDWPNRLAKVTAAKDLTGDPAAIKQYISTHGAVAACFIVYQDFFGYKTGIYRHVSGGQAGGHCVSIVGYDDTAGCWIVKNSWGAGWGEGGYFKIAYGECGIETWQVHGADGVSLRMWTGTTKVIGAYHASTPRSGYAYIENRGWLKITTGSDSAHELMLTDLLAARVGGRPVNLFENVGTIETSVVY